MFNLFLKSVFVFLLCMMVQPGCGEGAGSASNYQIDFDSQIVSLVWDTTGGGDMKFLIEKSDTGYRIRVERYNFKTINKVLALTGANADVLQLVDDVFGKEIDLHDYRYVPQGPTGTWTTITLIYSDNSEVKIDHIQSTGDLHILYDFVRDAVRSS